MIIQKEL